MHISESIIISHVQCLPGKYIDKQGRRRFQGDKKQLKESQQLVLILRPEMKNPVIPVAQQLGFRGLTQLPTDLAFGNYTCNSWACQHSATCAFGLLLMVPKQIGSFLAKCLQGTHGKMLAWQKSLTICSPAAIAGPLRAQIQGLECEQVIITMTIYNNHITIQYLSFMFWNSVAGDQFQPPDPFAGFPQNGRNACWLSEKIYMNQSL